VRLAASGNGSQQTAKPTDLLPGPVLRGGFFFSFGIVFIINVNGSSI
jgi:hypothetical protein